MSLTQFDASSFTPAVVILLMFFPRLIDLITSLPDIVPTLQALVENANSKIKVMFFTILPLMLDSRSAFPVR